MIGEKKVVRYRREGAYIPGVGGQASVFAYQHPDAWMVPLGEDAQVTTSRILAYNGQTGEFETLNTRYVPAE